jgi:hypothetical protein
VFNFNEFTPIVLVEGQEKEGREELVGWTFVHRIQKGCASCDIVLPETSELPKTTYTARYSVGSTLWYILSRPPSPPPPPTRFFVMFCIVDSHSCLLLIISLSAISETVPFFLRTVSGSIRGPSTIRCGVPFEFEYELLYKDVQHNKDDWVGLFGQHPHQKADDQVLRTCMNLLFVVVYCICTFS